MPTKRPQSEIDELLTAKDVKRVLNISLATVYNMVDRKQLPAVAWDSPAAPGKRGSKVIRFKREDVFNFIESNYQKGS